MTRVGWRRWLFVIAALYDGILGLVFLLFWPSLYAGFGVTPPNHAGYVQFPALMLIVFGAMFVQIARDPVGNRSLIPYGIGLKAAFSGVVFWNQITDAMPAMWIPWAWADLAFLVLFVAALRPIAAEMRRPAAV